MYDIVILGAGASGLMTASLLKKQNILIINNNIKIAQKIKVSGGGKCNITNEYMSEDFYLGDKQFVSTTLKQFSQVDLLKFLNKNKLYPQKLPKIVKGTYFCNSSNEVINMFKRLSSNCEFKLNTKVIDVDFIKEKNSFKIVTNTKIYFCKKLIVASGGISYPILDASDIGYKIASKFGHEIIKPNPALVGFTVQKEQFWFKELSGLSLEVEIKIGKKTINGQMLFTHKGCSGPAILSASLYWHKGSISINFLPKKDSYLPKRFKRAIKELDIDIKNYTFSPAGNFGYTKAEVTKGGVSTKDIDETMQSKKQKNLYFIGEVLDVTGELGGYNFQWAFSSAYVCAKALENKT